MLDRIYSTKIVVATSIERAHVRLIEYFAEKQNRTRNEIIRHAIKSYINSKANYIELGHEIDRLEELGKKWERAAISLRLKQKEERKLQELVDRRREDILFESMNTGR